MLDKNGAEIHEGDFIFVQSYQMIMKVNEVVEPDMIRFTEHFISGLCSHVQVLEANKGWLHDPQDTIIVDKPDFWEV